MFPFLKAQCSLLCRRPCWVVSKFPSTFVITTLNSKAHPFSPSESTILDLNSSPSVTLPQDSPMLLPDHAFSVQIFIVHQLNASTALRWGFSRKQHHLRRAGHPHETEVQIQDTRVLGISPVRSPPSHHPVSCSRLS